MRGGAAPSLAAMSRVAQRGQAAVETVGVAAMVALLLAAASAWLVREVRPPERPPAFIDAVSAPLIRDPAPFDYRYPLPGPAFEMPRGRDDEPIGRALRAAARGGRSAIVFGLEMNRDCSLAFGLRLAERAEDFLSDPAAGLGSARASADGDLRAYVERLRAMPRREAALTVVRDACGTGADIALEAGQDALMRRASRGPSPRSP